MDKLKFICKCCEREVNVLSFDDIVDMGKMCTRCNDMDERERKNTMYRVKHEKLGTPKQSLRREDSKKRKKRHYIFECTECKGIYKNGVHSRAAWFSPYMCSHKGCYSYTFTKKLFKGN